MKNNEVVFILDRSVSMEGKEQDTIGGFNGVLKEQRENKKDGDILISTILFDDRQKVLHDRVSINDIKDLTDKDYRVRGSTALLDALGGAIDHIKMVHRYIREEDIPEHTLFVVITDGLENASHKYSAKKVKKLVEEQKEKAGWDFMFIGANMDAITEAGQLGFDRDSSLNYCCDEIGNDVLYSSLSGHIRELRRSARGIKPCAKKTMAKVTADYKKRSKKK